MENRGIWIHEFYNKLDKNRKEALRYLLSHMPNVIYKYREFKTNENGINWDQTNITNTLMRFTNPCELDDGFEASLDIDIEQMQEATYECTKQMIWGNKNISNEKEFKDDSYKLTLEQMNRLKNNYKNSCIISCFTEKKDNPRMWKEYANDSQGICLEYDMKSLFSWIDCVDNLMFYPVMYVEKFETLSNPSIENFKSIAYRLFYKDINKYKHEMEWRIVKTIFNADTVFKDDYALFESVNLEFIKPSAIYLGEHFNSNYMNELCLFCADNKIKLFNTKTDNSAYTFNELNI